LNATVTQLNLADNGRSVISADVCGKTKKMRRVCAKAFVLCTGGIENARLLLASNKVAAKGIGNQNDLVGRYFMDHLRWAFATAKPPSQALQDRFCVHRLNHETGTHYYLTGFGLSPAVQKAEGLLNCAGWLMLDPAPDNPWDAVRRMGSTERNLIRDVTAIGANAGIVLRGVGRLARRMPVAHKLEKITLLADVEQRADRDSRVMLSDREKDFFGVPLPRIDWRTHDQERNTIRRLGLAAAQEFERLGLAKIDLAPWIVDPMGTEGSFEETFHPSGGTRMAREPNAGVVDEHCQVHGVEGLYVAGGSVFPTNSHVNPTLTIVALAIRVADRIKAQHFS
jgi:choline dehydrogenase-like flavoprotein